MKLTNIPEIKKIEMSDFKIFSDCWAIDFVAVPGQLFSLSGEMERQTAFLRCIAGLDEPAAGKILVNGENIATMSFDSFSALRRNIGYFFPLGGLLTNQSLFENLMLPFLHYEANYTSSERLVTAALKEFDLLRYRDKKPYEIPGIARKLACIARVKALDPQIILVEHLFGGLDENLKTILATWIDVKVKRGSIVFLNEHDVQMSQIEGSKPLYLGDSSMERVI